MSIIAASRGPDNAPTIARAAGCRLSADLARVTLLLARSQAGALLDAVQATGAISVVFSQPSSHRTIQLKATDAKVEPAGPWDAAIIARYSDAFAAEVSPLGYTEQLMRALVWAPDGDFEAVSFSPAAAFDQTPGPRAGSPLRR